MPPSPSRRHMEVALGAIIIITALTGPRGPPLRSKALASHPSICLSSSPCTSISRLRQNTGRQYVTSGVHLFIWQCKFGRHDTNGITALHFQRFGRARQGSGRGRGCKGGRDSGGGGGRSEGVKKDGEWGCSQLAKSSEGAPLLWKFARDFVIWQFPGYNRSQTITSHRQQWS